MLPVGSMSCSKCIIDINITKLRKRFTKCLYVLIAGFDLKKISYFKIFKLQNPATSVILIGKQCTLSYISQIRHSNQISYCMSVAKASNRQTIFLDKLLDKFCLLWRLHSSNNLKTTKSVDTIIFRAINFQINE